MENGEKRCPHPVADAIIKDTEGRVLFILRSTFPVSWACPAGHLETGERPEEAVRREVKEETNLDISETQLVLHHFFDNPCRRGFTSHERFVFQCVPVDLGVLRIDPSAADDARWVSKQDFAALKLSQEGVEEVWQKIIKKIPNEFWAP